MGTPQSTNIAEPGSSVAGMLTRLAEHAALWFRRDACLAIRFPYTGCDRCVRECPAEVLSLNGDDLALREGCLDCGRCVAVCQSHALHMPGTGLGNQQPDQPVQLDCQRVPVALSPENTLRPPCLGAVRVSELLALARGGSSITLLDRGWCERCPASGERHPAAAVVDEAKAWLRDTRPDVESTIRIESRPLSEEVAAQTIPDPLTRRITGRRGFLRHLAGEMAAVQLPPDPPPAPVSVDVRQRIEPVERLARLATVDDALPTVLLPHLTVGEGCCNHNVCARLCPTGALQVYEQGEDTGIRFDARRCIDCQACIEGCPEQALSLTSGGGSALPRTLTHHRLRHCFDCSRPFTTSPPTVAEPDDDGPPVCPTCLKSRRLMQSGFGALFPNSAIGGNR